MTSNQTPIDSPRPARAYSRRGVLAALGGLAGCGLINRASARTQSDYNTLSITSTGENKVCAYFFTVSGDLQATGDSVGDTAGAYDGFGRVGPERGTDTYKFRGSIIGFEIAGPAVVQVNGTTVDPRTDLPAFLNSLTVYDIEEAMDDGASDHVIQFSNPAGLTVYEIAMNGVIRATDNSADDLGGAEATHVSSHIGPTAGTDTYEISGTLTHFALVGQCDVLVDGNIVTAGETARHPAFDGRRWTLALVNNGTTTEPYRVAVTGDYTVKQTEFNEGFSTQSSGTSIATGELTPGDTDEVWFTGRIEGLSVDADIDVYLDGEPVSPGDYPAANHGQVID